MPFSPIAVNSKSFTAAGDGRYNLSTLAFGQPSNYLRVTGASLNRDRLSLTGAVTRVLEKDITVGTGTQRVAATVQLIITSPKTNFTVEEFDGMVSDISEFLTPATLNRLMAGES